MLINPHIAYVLSCLVIIYKHEKPESMYIKCFMSSKCILDNGKLLNLFCVG